MRIKRVFNNNAVIAYRDGGEVVVFGKGIGFKKTHGDTVDPRKVEKVFVTTNRLTSRLDDILREIPLEHIELTTHAVKQAESDLGMNFPSSTFFAVLDHLSFALKRAEKGQFLTSPLLWEIRNAYPEEYRAAGRTLTIVEEETGVRLPDDEAGTLAIHYYNAQDPDHRLESAYKSAELIGAILQQIQHDFGVELDPESADYNRLMTHLRFFVNGMVGEGERASVLDNSLLFEEVRGQYPDAYACALNIRDLVRAKLGCEVGNEELLYLMIHIQRNVSKS